MDALNETYGFLAGPGRDDFEPAARGESLSGLTFVAKDIFERPSRGAGLGLPDRGRPAVSAAREPELLRDLLMLGTTLVGPATMSALAFEPSGIGVGRNPWDAGRAPGGSSTGSAIAVAVGAVDFSIGSDTAGSIRIPAHCCGVSGYKPSFGLVPNDGAVPLAPSLDTIGFLARDVALLASITSALKLTDVGGRGERPRIAIAADLIDASEDGVRTACRGGLEVLAGSAGAVRTVEAEPVVRASGDAALRVLRAEAARALSPFVNARPESDELRRRVMSGHEIELAAHETDLRARGTAREAFLDLLGDADVLVLPVMPIETPALSRVDAGSPDFAPRTLYALSAYTRFANYLGLPALALPTGFDGSGMPVGLQLVARPGADGALLDVGTAFQRDSKWHRPVPPGVSGRPLPSKETAA